MACLKLLFFLGSFRPALVALLLLVGYDRLLPGAIAGCFTLFT
jgi:hypothetical protein